ncbi:hypothetical protein KGV55_03345 [Candidatus Gracilibacteria bacterium]|nr:hypothetical protein [Candidatus Gracilibacteria bacterium]
MRIALITLLIAALAFISSIAWMSIKKDDVNRARQITQTSPSLFEPRKQNTTGVDSSFMLETLKHQAKIEQEMEELKKLIAEKKIQEGNSQAHPTNAHQKAPQQTSQQIDPRIVPISAKFLAKIMPTITLKKINNDGIFGLKIFDKNVIYTTYEDSKFGITVIASMLPYDQFLQNFKALDDAVYTVNETKTFPFKSFYVNPKKSQANARLVMQVETQTLLVTLPKSKFNTFKKLILSK